MNLFKNYVFPNSNHTIRKKQYKVDGQLLYLFVVVFPVVIGRIIAWYLISKCFWKKQSRNDFF